MPRSVTAIAVSVVSTHAANTLRCWEPGKEESFVVAPSYTPVNTYPPSAGSVPLVSGTLFAHTAGAGVTGFNEDIFLATIYYAIDDLQRWGTADAKWPGSRMRASTGEDTAEMTEWEIKAERRLLNYRRAK